MNKKLEDLFVVFNDSEGKPPSNFYIVDALGNKVFIRKQRRDTAQAAADQMYGKGKYIVKAHHIQYKTKELTARS